MWSPFLELQALNTNRWAKSNLPNRASNILPWRLIKPPWQFIKLQGGFYFLSLRFILFAWQSIMFILRLTKLPLRSALFTLRLTMLAWHFILFTLRFLVLAWQFTNLQWQTAKYRQRTKKIHSCKSHKPPSRPKLAREYFFLPPNQKFFPPAFFIFFLPPHGVSA